MISNLTHVISFCLFFVLTDLVCQESLNSTPSVIKSVLTTAGSRAVSYNYTASDGRVMTTKIQQSIGQNGAVGLSNTTNNTVQQGYLNRVKLLNVDNTTVEFVETMDLRIYPNPFKDFVNIKFSKPTIYPVQIEVFDVRGRLVLNQEFEPSGQITLTTDRLEDSSYIIRISSGSNDFLKKLIKGKH
ncbi:MAG: T9SS type A sorting domain-containing protein [Flavobacteriaceae bacterium]|jgi:hypothetical protein|nr:T9SS type A sorting domain-containing protein [Flavobacteriaceae bacterium]